MFARIAAAMISLVFFVVNARALIDIRGVRMELPNLFENWTPRQIVENVAAVNLNAILCTVHPSVSKDPRLEEMLKLAHARGFAVHVALSTIVAGAISPSPEPSDAVNAVNCSGRLLADWLCPSKPAGRQQVAAFAR